MGRPRSTLNSEVNTDFSVQLAMADGSLSDPVRLGDILDFRGPDSGGRHAILQTARLPLDAFGGVDPRQARGIRLTFDATPTGTIYLADFRISDRVDAAEAASSDSAHSEDGSAMGLTSSDTAQPTGNRITRLRVDEARAELIVESPTPFLPQGALLVLRVDGKEYYPLRFPEDGSLNRVYFPIPESLRSSIKRGFITSPDVVVTYQGVQQPKWTP